MCESGIDFAKCDTHTRHIQTLSSTYSIVSQSKESAFPKAVIVVDTNQPVVANLATTESKFRQAVTRYWYDTVKKEVRAEKIFTLVTDSQKTFFAELILMDELALFLEGT